MPGTVLHRGNVGGLLAAWGCAVAAGMLLLAAYAAAPGDPGAPTVGWPAGTGLPLDAPPADVADFPPSAMSLLEGQPG